VLALLLWRFDSGYRSGKQEFSDRIVRECQPKSTMNLFEQNTGKMTARMLIGCSFLN
jgi:hypothetical protein